MNEKRFKLTTEEDICYCEYTYWKGDEPLAMEEVVDVLNEQQDQISYWKNKAMTLLMQVRILTSRMTDKEVKEFSKELED